MTNEDFLTKCRNLDPSTAVDRQQNLRDIQARLATNPKAEEQMHMKKNFKTPAIIAATLVGILSVSAVAYAAAPMVWRHFDTRITQGDEFVNDFFMAEMDMPDGTTSIGGGIDIDRAALEAAGGGVITVEVDGEEWIILDELHFDNTQDGLALLALPNVQVPTTLPEGFYFSRFTFPVNPHHHAYKWGVMPTNENAQMHFSNGTDEIILRLGSAFSPGCEDEEPVRIAFGVAEDLGQRAAYINGHEAVLSNDLTATEWANLASTTPFDWEWTTEHAIFSGDTRGYAFINMVAGDVTYGFFTESAHVTVYDLVRMAESMQ